MNRQELFDRTVARLDEIVTIDFEAYSALESSALVRKLLLDGDALIHQVNRQRRKRVRFEVATNPAYEEQVFADGPSFWAPAEALSPRLTIMPAPVIRSLSLDQFLAHRAMYVRRHDISVKDVVKQLANVEGGVHAGTAKTDVEKALHVVNEQLGIGGMGSVVRSVRGIADVVAVSLRPLVISWPQP